MIFFFGRSPEESAQTPIASGEGVHASIFKIIIGHIQLFALLDEVTGKLIFRRRRIEFFQFLLETGKEK